MYTDKVKRVARVIHQAALDIFAGRPSSFGGGWEEEQQTVWEGWGEQGGEQEQAALSAGLQGMGRGEEGAAVLSHTLEPHSVTYMFTQRVFPALEMRGCCKQQCALKPRSTWGLLFTALQQIHFIHCPCERVLLYFREMNQSKSGLRFLETVSLGVTFGKG